MYFNSYIFKIIFKLSLHYAIASWVSVALFHEGECQYLAEEVNFVNYVEPVG